MSKNIIIGIVSVIILVGGALLFFKKSAPINSVPIEQSGTSTAPTSLPASTQVQQTPSSTKPANGVQAQKPVVATPKILSAQMSASLSSAGTALKPSAVFSPTTPMIYAVLTLKNAVQRTQLSYIRYYEGKYVDSKVSHPSKDGAKYFHFDWALKAGKTRKVGNYSLVFYVNGNKAQTLNYSIK